jgi:hypothetical protein
MDLLARSKLESMFGKCSGGSDVAEVSFCM